jgi:low temperature requirement protein LtrA
VIGPAASLPGSLARVSRPLALRDAAEAHRASTWLELFFDLCFVIAVSALAADLHHHPDLSGIARFIALLVPVWWAWMGFTWFSTAFDNDDTVHRLAMLGAGLGIVWLAASVGSVGRGGDLSFILAFAFVMVLLVGLFLRARLVPGPAQEWATRSAVGNGLGIVVWLASLAVASPERYLLWAAGLAVLMLTPIVAVRSIVRGGYRVLIFHPGHIRERYGLFTIIVLGESLLAVASGTADAEWSIAGVVAGVIGFALASSIWWLYFGQVGHTALTLGATAAFQWGYGHLFVYAGIAAVGVGVLLTIESTYPGQGADLADGARLTLGLGSTLLLAALAFIAWTTSGSSDPVVRMRLVAAAGVVGLMLAAGALGLPPLASTAATAVAVAGLTVAEELRARRPRPDAAGTPPT